MSPRPELLYILAPSFSGSTLLTYLLAQHPKISTVGELKASQMGPVEDYHCSCGDPIQSCEFWNALKAKAQEHEIDFSLERFGTVFGDGKNISAKVVQATVRGRFFEWIRTVALHVIPGVSAHLESVARQNRILTDIICQIQGGKIFLDGSKDAARLMHMINSGHWNIKVVYLQRDGRGVTASIRSHGDTSYSEAISEWQHSVTELQRMRDRLDDETVFDLHYEELCSRPNETMQGLYNWLSLKQIEVQESQFKNGDFHILGNAMRLNAMSEIRLDEKWKNTLEPEQLKIFETRAGALNRDLGYA